MAKTTKDLERSVATLQKKELQAREGKQAMAEYQAAGIASAAKTERLRALRLAKEEMDRKAAADAPPETGKKKVAKPKIAAADKPRMAKKR